LFIISCAQLFKQMKQERKGAFVFVKRFYKWFNLKKRKKGNN